jgi:hypothetical protein
MESRSELKNIESIVGDVLSENKGKVSDCFSTNKQYLDGSRKEKRTTHYTKST